jgi:hypothetical protein
MRAPKRALSLFAIGVALALAFFVVPAVTDSGQKASAEWPYTLIYYDGHMHTTRSDGNGSVAQIKATAQARGLSAVIITDHCKDLTQAEWASLKADTAAVSDGTFLALPAFEMTGSEGLLNRGHMNAYNAPDPFVGDDALELCPEEVWPDPPNPAGTGADAASLAEWAQYIHAQGGIVNHNHPSGTSQLSYGMDNIEVYNQGHVDDIASYAEALSIPPDQALGFGLSINDFTIYGETPPAPYAGLNSLVSLPGTPFPVSLRWALWYATLQFTGVGQILGSGSFNPANPVSPGNGDLNSWDDLLMAYVNGAVDKPIFAVANSDSHNTGDPDSTVGSAKNGLLVKKLTAKEVYKAIEAGRSFATTGPSLAVDVNGMLMGSTAYIPKGGSANLNLSVNSESPTAVLAKIDIVKNGQVVQTISPLSPSYATALSYPMTERGYYRVEVTSVDGLTGAYHFAYSNPVFVKCPFDKDCDGYLDLIEKLLGSNPDDATSTPESIFVPGTCKDSLDNDADTLIDAADPGCRWGW